MFLYSGPVTRHGKRRAQTATTALSIALVASCSTAEPATAPAPAPTGSASSTAPTASAAPSRSPKPGPGAETPATTSGTLSRRTFPAPRSLGAGWSYAVDPGDAEEGYLGNGTPTLERDPREVVQLAVPFGCPRRSRMPTPEHALEVDYTADGVKVIALRFEFADVAGARTFFAARAANLRRCVGRSGGPALGVLVARVDRLGNGGLLSDRTPSSDPWAELAVLDRDQVALVAARTTLHHGPMTSAGVRRLASLFRR